MALTKAVESITDWTAVAQNAVGESAVLDCSGHYETMLAIQAFLDSTTAHDGTRFIVQVSSATSGDEDWHTLVQFLLLVGTANSENITDNPLSSGSTTISVASTTGYDADTAIYIGIEDGTLADSEICLLVSHVANTSITIQDGTANEHAQNTTMYNKAISQVVEIPRSVYRCRVIVDNTYDSGGASLNYRVRATKVTAI